MTLHSAAPYGTCRYTMGPETYAGSKIMKSEYPILEHDGSESSLIEPSQVLPRVEGVPEHCVLPMYHHVVTGLREESRLTHIMDMGWAIGPFPVCGVEHNGQQGREVASRTHLRPRRADDITSRMTCLTI